jgi:hypothetical protein
MLKVSPEIDRFVREIVPVPSATVPVLELERIADYRTDLRP